MKKAICLISLFILLTGCIDYTSTVKLNPDGSGTIEETVLISDMIKQMMTSFAQSFGGDSADVESGFEIFDEEELKNEALQMGKGVSYVKGEKIKINGKEGYKAFYKFEDIAELKLSDSPTEKIPGDDMMMEETAEENSYITFDFSKGDPSVLKVVFPLDDEEEEDIAEEDEFGEEMPDEMPDEQTKMLLKDFKVSMKLELIGDIVETNATHVDDNTITIFEMDFEELLNTPEKFSELQKMESTSLQDTKELLKDIPGFKIELNENVFVKFK